MKKIVVVGANGKMGSCVCEVLQSDFDIIKVDKNDSFENVFDVDLLIDFANAESSVKSARWCSKNNVKLIIGSTGQTQVQFNEIYRLCKNIPYIISGNFSLGIVKVKQVIKILKNLSIDNICIIEKHHKNKKDKPSGTALELAKIIEQELNLMPEILSERGGQEIGTHKIDFYFESEKISIEHQAFSRDAFAVGVKKAVEFLLQQKTAKKYKFNEIY